jgi:hypothetical protein
MEKRDNKGRFMKGNKHSENTIRKIRENKKGRITND